MWKKGLRKKWVEGYDFEYYAFRPAGMESVALGNRYTRNCSFARNDQTLGWIVDRYLG